MHDLALELESQQELAFIGQKAPLVAQVRRRGLGIPQATLVLSQDDHELERRTITFDATGQAVARFDVGQERPGSLSLPGARRAGAGEVILVNNDDSFLLRVVDEPIRVLLLEGKPYWDAKFLVRTLGEDPSIELESVVRLAQGRFLRRRLTRPKPGGTAAGAAPPRRRPRATHGVDDWNILPGPAEVLGGKDGLARYQIVVLGRDADVFLGEDSLARLREWIVKEGGSLVCYRGAPAAQLAQPLSRLLPVPLVAVARVAVPRAAHRARPRAAVDSRRRPTGQAGDELAFLPTLARSEQPHEPKPLAVVLATSTPATTSGADGGSTPVVTYQPYGAGRTVVIEGAGMWRWAFLPPEQREQGDLYGSLWHGLIRWLASGARPARRGTRWRSAPTRPSSGRVSPRPQRSSCGATPLRVTFRRSIWRARHRSRRSNSRPSLREKSRARFAWSSGRCRKVAIARGSCGQTDPPRLPSDEIAFDVRGFAEEQLDRAARPDLMARIAQESGGAVLATGSAAELITAARSGERSKPHRTRSCATPPGTAGGCSRRSWHRGEQPGCCAAGPAWFDADVRDEIHCFHCGPLAAGDTMRRLDRSRDREAGTHEESRLPENAGPLAAATEGHCRLEGPRLGGIRPVAHRALPAPGLTWSSSSRRPRVSLPSAAAIVLGPVLAIFLAWRGARLAIPSVLARRLDQAGAAHGEIVAGVDLLHDTRVFEPTAAGLAAIAVERAANLARGVPEDRRSPRGGQPWRPRWQRCCRSACVALVSLALPRMAECPLGPILRPVWRPSPLLRRAFPDRARRPSGGLWPGRLDPSDRRRGARWTGWSWCSSPRRLRPSAYPMFQESSGHWRAAVANVTAPARYFVSCRRSPRTQRAAPDRRHHRSAS